MPGVAHDQNNLNTYQEEVRKQIGRTLNSILAQWPRGRAPTLRKNDVPPLDVKAIKSATGTLFEAWFRNYELWQHFDRVKPLLQKKHVSVFELPAMKDYRLDWDSLEWNLTENPIPSLNQVLEHFTCPLIEAAEIVKPSESYELTSQEN